MLGELFMEPVEEEVLDEGALDQPYNLTARQWEDYYINYTADGE